MEKDEDATLASLNACNKIIEPLIKKQKGRIFKDDESAKIWISDDSNRALIRVETKILVGTIVTRVAITHLIVLSLSFHTIEDNNQDNQEVKTFL